MNDFRNGRHVVFMLHAHIVFVAKYRKNVMTNRVSELIKKCFEDVCVSYEVELEEYQSDKDHVHLLVSYPPKIKLSSLVASLKIKSSKAIRQQNFEEIRNALWGKHFWSPSYCIVSTGGAPLQIVKKYIENQQKPNKKRGHQSKYNPL
jgi:putative transposase